jgi:polysaccharide deacetylase 2 family uncharacterized protein YibQ
MLAYALFFVLIAGVAAIRHLHGVDRVALPAPPVPDAVEARIFAVLRHFGVAQNAIRTQPAGVDGGGRSLTAALPDSVSLTRVNLAITQSVRDLPISIADCQLTKMGQVLDMRLEHAGRTILGLQLRRSIRKHASMPSAIKVATLPQVAIIIDDIGHNEGPLVLDLLELAPGLTFGVLPGRPHARNMALRCYRLGREVILHQPMEAITGQDPGLWAIRTGMQPTQIAAIVRHNLERVPCAVGVNNHMGSKATGDSLATNALMRVIAEEGALFFVDSRTTPHSLALHSARHWQVPAAEAAVFLDSRDDRQAIEESLGRLAKIAASRGRAIGIGHPRPRTYEALAVALEQNEGRVWNLVPASVVVGLEQT